jgi:hypothetical protein
MPNDSEQVPSNEALSALQAANGPAELLAALSQLHGTAPIEPLVPDQPLANMRDHVALKRRGLRKSFHPLDPLAPGMVRDIYIAEYGFVVLSKELLDTLASLLGGREVLDAGAGPGYLSSRLGSRGVRVTASDLGASHDASYGFGPTHQRDHEGDSVELLPGNFNVVLLSWPPMSDFAHRIATAMTAGQILVYQGEPHGGCTADESFFAQVEDDAQWEHLDTWTAALNQHHLQFQGIHDRWAVWQKR